MRERWLIKNIKGDFEKIAQQFGVSPIMARLLVNRGLEEKNKIEYFLKAEEKELASPALMKDMMKGCEIIDEKIKEGKKIRIIGDYDVDGVCSTFVLYDFFCGIGADVSYEIPDRVKDGYGINENILDEAFKDGIDTILTCDNGIAAYHQVEHGKKMGMTLVVTDHHDIPLSGILPPADAVINPKQEDCAYPFKLLCGAGVAYQFICYFNAKYNKQEMAQREMEKKYLPFAALATVCDVMELREENRSIVKKGLPLLKATENVGMKALLQISGLDVKEKITIFHCGFVIGPMVNASGRLESAKKALELFLTKDKETSLKIAEELVELNEERKGMTERGVELACNLAEKRGYEEDKVLVILLEDIHESIAGIVAGRVKERYHKPTLIFTKAERGIKGSGRSIEAYNMFEEISKCADCFSKFGGHPMAAGFSLAGETEEEQLKNLDRLRIELNQNTRLTEEDLLPKVRFDMVIPFSKATESFVQELSLLEPFGVGNPSPSFARKEVLINEIRILGKNENVVRLELLDGEDGGIYQGIWFGEGREFETYLRTKKEKKLDVIFTPEINEYQGKRSVQLKISHYR